MESLPRFTDDKSLYLMIYSVFFSWERPSGERPLCDVLLCQVVVQVSSQSTDRHRRHVTGTAVWQMKENSLLDNNKNPKLNQMKYLSFTHNKKLSAYELQ